MLLPKRVLHSTESSEDFTKKMKDGFNKFARTSSNNNAVNSDKNEKTATDVLNKCVVNITSPRKKKEYTSLTRHKINE